jgi:plasmid stability protein
MGNLTIAIDEESLKKARIRALHEGTSVNALLREFLESYAGVRREQKAAAGRIAAFSRSSRSRRGG